MNANPSSTLAIPRPGMAQVARAMACDFLIRGRTLIYQPLFAALMALLCYMILARLNPISPQEIRFIFFMGLLIEFLVCSFSLSAFQSAVRLPSMKGGFPPRLFTLPVGTRHLVFWHMAPGFAFILFSHLVLVFAVWRLTGVRPPFLAPVTWLAAMYAWTAAVLWTMSAFVFWKYIVLTIAAGTLGSWMMHYYIPGHFAKAPLIWIQPSLANLAGLALSVAMACGVAAFGVSCDRRGDPLELPGFEALWNGLMDRLPQRQRVFASPQSAQLWLEFRQKGLMAAVMLAFLIALVGLWLVFRFQGISTRGLFDFTAGLSFLGVIFLSLPIGPTVGVMNHSPQRGDIDLFRATRPLSDRALAYAALRCGGISILTSWLVGLAGMAVVWLWLVAHGDAGLLRNYYQEVAKEFEINHLGLWIVPLLYLACLLAAWTLLSLLSLMTMCGRGKFLATVLTFLLVSFFGMVTILSQLTPDAKERFLVACGFIVGVGCLLGSLLGYYSASRRRLIAPALAWFGHAWSLLAIIISSFVFHSEPLAIRLFAAGLGCLPVAPLALAPLALAWNRHR